MFYFFGLLLLIIIFLLIAKVRAAKNSRIANENKVKTFKEYNGIEDYEKEIKLAVYEIVRSRTLLDKIECYFKLRILSDSIYCDYEQHENVYQLLHQALEKKFLFTFSSFITKYPEPIEESGLERFYLVNTRKYCPSILWAHIIESAYYTDKEISEYYDDDELNEITKMSICIDFYNTFMGCVMYDEKVGFFITEESEVPKILDNEIHTVTEEELSKWLDEELAFIAYYSESLLKICLKYIKADDGIIRV